MADLDEIQASQTVELTDGNTQAAVLATAKPGASEIGLVVREAQRGQQTSANSIPVVLPTDQEINLTVGGASGTDANGRLRVAEPVTIFDHFFNQDDGSLFWDTSLTGSATISKDANENAINLTLTTASGDIAIHQTKPYFPHQAGKTHQVLLSGVMGALKTNVRQRIGYFDANNGLFFEQDGTNLKVVRRSNTSGSVVDTAVNQSSWNDDTLDGAGASGITVNMSLIQQFVIDFGWLGAGSIRFGFNFNGTVIYGHEFNIGNTLSVASINTPTLPLRYEIENTGTAASGTTLKQICATVLSEGGWNPLGIVRCVDTGTSEIDAVGEVPLVSVRLKTANNRAIVMPVGLSAGTTNGKDIVWRLYLGNTLTGPSWGDVSSTSFTQVDTSATALSGGEVVACGFATADQSVLSFDIKSSLWLASNIAGTSDIMTLAASRLGSGIAKTVGALSFKEFL